MSIRPRIFRLERNAITNTFYMYRKLTHVTPSSRDGQSNGVSSSITATVTTTIATNILRMHVYNMYCIHCCRSFWGFSFLALYNFKIGSGICNTSGFGF